MKKFSLGSKNATVKYEMKIKSILAVHDDNSIVFYDMEDKVHTVVLSRGQSGRAILRFDGNTYYILVRGTSKGEISYIPFIRQDNVVYNTEEGTYSVNTLYQSKTLNNGTDDYFMVYTEPKGSVSLSEEERIFVSDIVGHSVVFNDSNGKVRNIPLNKGKYGLSTFNYRNNVYYLLCKYIDDRTELLTYLYREGKLISNDGDIVVLDDIARKGIWLAL